MYREMVVIDGESNKIQDPELSDTRKVLFEITILSNLLEALDGHSQLLLRELIVYTANVVSSNQLIYA